MASDEQKPEQPAKAGLSLEDFILLNEEIAGMARAGLPLDQGLAALAGEMGSGRLRSVTAEIAVDLKAGLTLPQAIERQGGRMPAYYARLLAAGIRSGRVGDVISTMTVYARTLADLRQTVVGALLYPCVVLVLSLIVFAGLSFYLVPQFKQIYQEFHFKMPWPTAIAFQIFDNAVWILAAVLMVGIAALLWARLLTRRSADGRTAWARFWYAVPVVGTLLRSARLAAFTDLMGILVDNNVPLAEAFLLAGQSSSDPIMAVTAAQVHQSLSQGMPLGSVLCQHRLVPQVVAWMVSLGEKRGTLGPALHQAGDMYRRQAEMRANLLRSVLPPLLVIVVGGFAVILFLVILLLPIFNLIFLLENLGGGKK